VEKGEKEIDFKFGTVDSAPRQSMASLGLGYGANDWWFTEVYLKYAKTGGDGVKYDAVEWEVGEQVPAHRDRKISGRRRLHH